MKCWGTDPDMASFSESQSGVSQARSQYSAAVSAASSASEARKQLAGQLEQLTRTTGPKDEEGLQQIQRLQVQIKEANANVDSKRSAVTTARSNIDQAPAQFSVFSDPRHNIGSFSDALPFLLFPVRIETRFVNAGDQHQLWVRVDRKSTRLNSSHQ